MFRNQVFVIDPAVMGNCATDLPDTAEEMLVATWKNWYQKGDG
jgi:hypothetical protein